ncbi:MAG: hypothetical protein LBC42_01245, partial [Puniceicoccales bacterium]|nr:hypothetical protein [Puniceicoccales bacterium]
MSVEGSSELPDPFAAEKARIAKFTRIRNRAIGVTGIALAVGCSTTWVSPLTGCIAFSIAALGMIVAFVAHLAIKNLEKEIQLQEILDRGPVDLEKLKWYIARLSRFDFSAPLEDVFYALDLDLTTYAQLFDVRPGSTLGDLRQRSAQEWQGIFQRSKIAFPDQGREAVIALLISAQVDCLGMSKTFDGNSKVHLHYIVDLHA